MIPYKLRYVYKWGCNGYLPVIFGLSGEYLSDAVIRYLDANEW
jgi:hypothetical protein